MLDAFRCNNNIKYCIPFCLMTASKFVEVPNNDSWQVCSDDPHHVKSLQEDKFYPSCCASCGGIIVKVMPSNSTEDNSEGKLTN